MSHKEMQNLIDELKSPTGLVKRYTEWAKEGTYETMLEATDYNFKMASDCVGKHYPPESRKKLKLLDVGAGTGLVGIELRKMGFLHLDALDPTDAMLEEARKRGIYENYFVKCLTGDRTEEIEDNTYDVIVSCGAMVEGHLPAASLSEMARIVKPGGIVVLECRHSYLKEVPDYRDNLEPLMVALETEGKWTCLETTVFPNYIMNCEGILWKFLVK